MQKIIAEIINEYPRLSADRAISIAKDKPELAIQYAHLLPAAAVAWLRDEHPLLLLRERPAQLSTQEIRATIKRLGIKSREIASRVSYPVARMVGAYPFDGTMRNIAEAPGDVCISVADLAYYLRCRQFRVSRYTAVPLHSVSQYIAPLFYDSKKLRKGTSYDVQLLLFAHYLAGADKNVFTDATPCLHKENANAISYFAVGSSNKFRRLLATRVPKTTLIATIHAACNMMWETSAAKNIYAMLSSCHLGLTMPPETLTAIFRASSRTFMRLMTEGYIRPPNKLRMAAMKQAIKTGIAEI